MENNSFEEKMKKLNEIVEKLSDESVSLNDSLNLYVEGKEIKILISRFLVGF